MQSERIRTRDARARAALRCITLQDREVVQIPRTIEVSDPLAEYGTTRAALADEMGLDLCGLVRRDHDDLDLALGGMVNPTTSPRELAELLEIFRLALAVHTATETRVLDNLIKRVTGPRMLGLIVTQTRVEHVLQRDATDALAARIPGSSAWYESALELRVLVLDHAGRAERTRWTLQDHVPRHIERALASEYATERMRVLASTSPVLEAQRRVSLATATAS